MENDLLNAFGIKDVKDYDDLTEDEQVSYRKMLEIVQSSSISLEDMKRYIRSMRQSVEYELAKLNNEDPKNYFLKARLLNYILFESFFDRPERARQQLIDYNKRQRLKL